MFCRSIAPIANPVNCGPRLRTFGCECCDPCPKGVALAFINNANRCKFIATQPLTAPDPLNAIASDLPAGIWQAGM